MPRNLISSSDLTQKKDSPAKSRPAFVVKLWLMVNDEANSEHIHWSSLGKGFRVVNREMFMQKVLPKYFKHLNFLSFVRQLNMYGWHKVQDTDLPSRKDVWQFQNPYFQRGKEELLDNIARTKARPDDSLDVDLVVAELNRIRAAQSEIAENLRRVQANNDALWRELQELRARHSRHGEALDGILRFITLVFGPGAQELPPDRPEMAMLHSLMQQQQQIRGELEAERPEAREMVQIKHEPEPELPGDRQGSKRELPKQDIPIEELPDGLNWSISEMGMDQNGLDVLGTLSGTVSLSDRVANAMQQSGLCAPSPVLGQSPMSQNFRSLMENNSPDFSGVNGQVTQPQVSLMPLTLMQLQAPSTSVSLVSLTPSSMLEASRSVSSISTSPRKEREMSMQLPLLVLEESINKQAVSINSLTDLISRYVPEEQGQLLRAGTPVLELSDFLEGKRALETEELVPEPEQQKSRRGKRLRKQK